MRRYSIFILLFFVAACSGPAFKYNKKTACEINYGENGISVIVDKSNIFVKNNTQIYYNNLLSVTTKDRIYTTLGRYFSQRDVTDMVNSLRRSDRIFLIWQNNSGHFPAGGMPAATINVSDFGARFDKCIKEQQ